MHNLSMEELDKLALNRYQAIIIASQHARNLNLTRLKALEKMEENPDIEIEARKITMVALKDLIEGNVKFSDSDSM